ncbi:unnamed protein product [Paramecium octaurelia]|uniref:Uncharacterized protein n=1 Tax=Paramecium octaurelia TaxID=43137 RepID=A0A8S1XGK2_PAROT|nr:unnamed protein product [Paramecium octaurelia]
MTNKVFRMKISDVKIGQLIQKASSQKLLEGLEQLNIGKPWGFDQDHHPDNQWMVNVLFTLNPNHKLFKDSVHECQSILTQEDLKMIQSFNTSSERQSQGRFFKQQTLEYKLQMKQIRAQNKQNKLKNKKQEIIKLNQQIEELEDASIQEEHQT